MRMRTKKGDARRTRHISALARDPKALCQICDELSPDVVLEPLVDRSQRITIALCWNCAIRAEAEARRT
jgi:hypothetical protein